MMGNKFVAIFLKLISLNENEEQMENILTEVNRRYQAKFEKEEDKYICYMPLQKDCMDMISYIYMMIQPHDVVFAMGVSEEMNEHRAIEVAYRQAKVALKQLLRQRKRRDYRQLYAKIQLPSEYKALSIAFNTMLLLDCEIQNRWTQKQRDIVSFGYFEEKNQKETAEHFHVSQPNVHQVLKKANYSLYRDIRKSYQSIFEQMIF